MKKTNLILAVLADSLLVPTGCEETEKAASSVKEANSQVVNSISEAGS